jgi:hypothetical protein
LELGFYVVIRWWCSVQSEGGEWDREKGRQ